MKRVFSAWRNADGSQQSLWSGDEPPVAADGRPIDGCDVLLWRIEAGSLEEAQAVKHLRFGFVTYVPNGNAAPCPSCGSLYYPNGSAQCWNCDHVG